MKFKFEKSKVNAKVFMSDEEKGLDFGNDISEIVIWKAEFSTNIPLNQIN